MKTSIQRRLFTVLGVFVLALTLLWAGLSLLLAYIVEDEIIDQVLATEVGLIQQAYMATDELPAPRLPQLTLYLDTADVPASLRPYLQVGVGGEVFSPGASHYHYRWLQLPGLAPVLLVAEVSPWLVVRRMSTSLLILLVTGLVVALLLSLVAAFSISRLTTRPLRELTAAIEKTPRPSPLPHVDQGDEVGVLAAAMEGALASLQVALARETAFTRDVGHELRTPLMAMRNAVTLLPEVAASADQRQQLLDASAAIEGMLTTLLALARAESSALAPLPLRACCETLLVARADCLEARAFTVDLDVGDDITVPANSPVTRLLLGNLIDNALNYAEPARLAIQLQGRSLVLDNPVTPGVPPAHSTGLGHGLSLAQRLAQAQGWQLLIEKRPDHFCARLSW